MKSSRSAEKTLILNLPLISCSVTIHTFQGTEIVRATLLGYQMSESFRLGGRNVGVGGVRATGTQGRVPTLRSLSHRNTRPCAYTQEAERDRYCYSASSLRLYSIWGPVHGMGPHSEWVFPLHLNFWEHPQQTHPETCFHGDSKHSQVDCFWTPDKGLGCIF